MILTRDNEYCAVLDTCVLAPMPLCDTLLRCAEEPALYRAAWSEETLVELMRTLVKFGYQENQAMRRIEKMREAFPDASVAVPTSLLRAVPEIPDAQDKHVVAAAIRVHAQAIVTFNLRDFPDAVMNPYGILVQSPDDFLLHQYHLDPERIEEVLDIQASGIGKRRSYVLEQLQTGLPGFVALVSESRL